MIKNKAKTGHYRLILGVLSMISTVALALGLGDLATGCAPVNNWSGHTKAPKAAYQTSLSAGNSASDLLAKGSFNKLAVEIQAVRGFAPTDEALTHLQRFLETRLDKPAGITISVTGELPSSASATATTSASANPNSRVELPANTPGYSSTDIQNLEHKHRSLLPHKDQLTVYLMFLDGAAAGDATDSTDKTLGAASGNTSITIFENSLREAAALNPAVAPWVVEATVMEHEFGHLLGLVHTPIADIAHHEDSNHPGHCSAANCLMHHAFETTAGIVALSAAAPGATGATGPTGSVLPPVLDGNCLQDLKAAGGK